MPAAAASSTTTSSWGDELIEFDMFSLQCLAAVALFAVVFLALACRIALHSRRMARVAALRDATDRHRYHDRDRTKGGNGRKKYA
jgi:hypothetical protein